MQAPTARGQGFDLLGSIKNSQTPLFLSLVGFRQSISRHLGIRTLPMIMHDNAKAVMRREQADYPYGFFRINSIEVKKDQQVVKTIKRHGSAITLDDITNATISKGYLFPATIAIELHFIHNNPQEVLLTVEKAAILGAVDAFSFEASMPGVGSWQVGVILDEGPIQIPAAEIENESEPSAHDITLSFQMNTRLGVTKAVPKINNEGKVTQRLVANGAEEEV